MVLTALFGVVFLSTGHSESFIEGILMKKRKLREQLTEARAKNDLLLDNEVVLKGNFLRAARRVADRDQQLKEVDGVMSEFAVATHGGSRCQRLRNFLNVLTVKLDGCSNAIEKAGAFLDERGVPQGSLVGRSERLWAAQDDSVAVPEQERLTDGQVAH